MNPVGGANVQQIIAMRERCWNDRLLRNCRRRSASCARHTGRRRLWRTLQNALASVNEAQQNASSISDAYERGQVHDVTQVMLARQEAGVAFEATLQVRNKLLSAYQDIMRMGV